MSTTCDLMIIGGGIMGASISYNLKNDGFDGKVVVFEKDPLYTYSSTTLSAAGIREQFSQPVSIKMANYDIAAFERFEEEMAVDDMSPSIGFKQIGQMIVTDAAGLPTLKSQAQLQQKLGAKVDILSVDDILDIIPGINADRVAGGTISRRGGILDAYGLLQGYVKKGKSLGVQYVYDEVTKAVCKNRKFDHLTTAKGNT